MPTLYEMIMRHALYFEGARRGAVLDFGKIVRGLDAEILRVFQTTSVDTFGAMTRADFNQFVAKLRIAMNDVFRKEGKRFNGVARQLVNIETSLYQRMFRANTGKRIRVNTNNIWAKVRNREIGATGATMERSAVAFRNSSINAVERLVRRGYADKLAVQEVISSIRGTSERSFSNGALARISAWSDSYSSTLLTHVGQTTKYETSSLYYEEYDWSSEIDDVTTDICLDRDGERYRYGEGPIPPAHYNCRSEIVPVDPENDVAPQSFRDFLADQPGEFLSDVFKAGRTDLDNVKVITLDAFKGKLDFILVG